jgi:hypothetical protein
MIGVPLPEQVVPVSNSNNGNKPPANQAIIRPQRPRPPRPRPSSKPNWNDNRRPQPIPQPDMDQLSPSHKPGTNKKTEHTDNKMSITAMEDDDNQDNREYQYTTLQAPAILQEGEEFVTTTTTSKSQLPPVDMPSSISDEEDVPLTTEDTRDEIPNKAEKEKVKHTGYVNTPGLNSSTEEPKIIATLTSSSSTVHEATQGALFVTSESTEAHDTGVLAGSSSEIPILEPSKGVGIAMPVLESSMHEIITHDSTVSSEWEEPQGPETSTGTPTSVLPSNLPSLSGETSSGTTSSSSHAKDKLKQTTGKCKMYFYTGCFKKSFTTVFQTLLCGYCYENVYTYSDERWIVCMPLSINVFVTPHIWNTIVKLFLKHPALPVEDILNYVTIPGKTRCVLLHY